LTKDFADVTVSLPAKLRGYVQQETLKLATRVAARLAKDAREAATEKEAAKTPVKA
jgi:hypothetical protein